MSFPDHDVFKQRGKALEAAYFSAKDQQLLEVLRRRLTAEEAEELLAAATGVREEIAVRELAGVSDLHFLAALGIFPLVAVAWCDGEMNEEERKAVLTAAHNLGVSHGSPSHQLLERWLQSCPADNAIQLWSNYVHAICKTLEPETVAKLKQGVIGRAEGVALAAGGFLGLGNKISAKEQACLDELAMAFVV